MATPNRRGTLFPGSPNPNGLGKREFPNDEDSSRLSASQIPSIPEDLPNKRRAPLPAALPVKINAHSQQFSTSSRFPRPTPSVARREICTLNDPWKLYYPILEEDQAGHVTIAYKHELKHPIVVIKKQIQKAEDNLKRISSTSHENVVSLYDAHSNAGDLYLVYESMDVSLTEIQSTPYGTLAEFHIATICKEVIFVYHVSLVSMLTMRVRSSVVSSTSIVSSRSCMGQ